MKRRYREILDNARAPVMPIPSTVVEFCSSTKRAGSIDKDVDFRHIYVPVGRGTAMQWWA